jgi:guanine nucleotide-binding protein alpha-1 subunit
LFVAGQSESGKTATLKSQFIFHFLNPGVLTLSTLSDFQLTYARREWSEERASWRSVIQLNLVRNVNEILDHLTQEMSGVTYDPNADDDSIEEVPARRNASTLPPLRFKEKHRLLKMRLGPLTGVQSDLEQKLGAGATELYTTAGITTAAPFDSINERRALQEFSVNSSNGWKSALEKFRTMRAARPEAQDSSRKGKDREDDLSDIIASCRDDIKAIWEDPTVKEMLGRRKVRIEDSAGL